MSLARPLVVCGPSGVGKGTLIGKLLKEFPQHFGFSVSHTTRGPRPMEQNGVHYHFTNHDSFEKMIKENQFIEFAKVNVNMYGTSVDAVKSVLNKGLTCVLDIDVQGAMQLRKKPELNPFYVFISPPSFAELEARLRGRKTESEESILGRLTTAKWEMEQMQNDAKHELFDVVLVNGELEQAYDDFKTILKQHLKLPL